MNTLPRPKRKRPIAVTVVAWTVFIMFLARLYQVFDPLLKTGVFDNGINKPLFDGLWLTPFGRALLTSGTYTTLSITGIIVLIGFIAMKRWSWAVLMVWTAISLTITLFDYFYFNTEANYVIMASDTVVAFALSQADVQRIFGIKRDSGERLD